MIEIEESLLAHYPLDKETLQAVLTSLKPFKASKKNILLAEGSVCKQLFFLTKGSIRSMHFHHEEAHTDWAFFEGEWFTSWYSFHLQKPAIEQLQALEDVEGYTLSYEAFQQLHQDYSEFSAFLSRFYQSVIVSYDFLFKKALTFTAREKFEFMLEQYPMMFQRLAVKDLASILGMSRETLSRLRSKR